MSDVIQPRLAALSTTPMATDRREFLRCTACSLAALALAACGGGDEPAITQTFKKDTTVVVTHDTTTVVQTGDPKFEIAGSQITVYTSRISDLDPIPGFFLIDAATTIILHTGVDQYRALTAICTHEGCTVNGFSASSMILVCPCHGSQYGLTGNVIQGPATGNLAEFPTTFDTDTKILLVTKTA